MILGFLLFYVGAVLFLNGLWLMARIQDREIVVINVVSGLVAGAVVVQGAFGAGAEAASIRFAGGDGRGLGWFSLFVAITTIPVFVSGLTAAATGRDIWLAGNWVVWGVLWFMYFLLLALGKPILKQTAWVTLLSGIFTGWLPGWLLLDGLM